MEAILLTEDTANNLFSRLASIEACLKAIKTINYEWWLDNDEAQKLLKVSKRTLQNWRDMGIIAFSQVGHKIYYRRSDVDAMLLKHYNQAFKPP
ncbi:helix-turn-helix domain-containing protein [Sabulibacter ruber]|uniref:helix-turn-helix domain-containing protein n=1 Tax=Sabulibacter ruber TaxID=2811901 RepID=UPI001A975951|nr:helix-turn-helix domain-containing protein [Sabulibacter ruber]